MHSSLCELYINREFKNTCQHTFKHGKKIKHAHLKKVGAYKTEEHKGVEMENLEGGKV